jgi:hypothetical protein
VFGQVAQTLLCVSSNFVLAINSVLHKKCVLDLVTDILQILVKRSEKYMVLPLNQLF